MTRTEALQWRHKIEQAATHLPDDEAVDSVELFPAWQTEMFMSREFMDGRS